MKEVEAKIYKIDAPRIRADLKKLGAVPVKNVLQKNLYYSNPHTLQHKVKVRIRTEGTASVLQVKVRGGVKDRYKTEDEYELPADLPTAQSMLAAMGFTIIDEVHIKREYFKLHDCTVEICQLPRVKPYLEIEGARAQIDKVAAALGFDPKQYSTEGPRKHFRMKGKKWVF